jgi:hypothetical protein
MLPCHKGGRHGRSQKRTLQARPVEDRRRFRRRIDGRQSSDDLTESRCDSSGCPAPFVFRLVPKPRFASIRAKGDDHMAYGWAGYRTRRLLALKLGMAVAAGQLVPLVISLWNYVASPNRAPRRSRTVGDRTISSYHRPSVFALWIAHASYKSCETPAHDHNLHLRHDAIYRTI